MGNWIYLLPPAVLGVALIVVIVLLAQCQNRNR